MRQLSRYRRTSLVVVACASSTERFPTDLRTLDRARPVYETLPGFSGDLSEARDIADLPDAARDYLQFVSDRLKVPITVIGTGPKREETLVAS